MGNDKHLNPKEQAIVDDLMKNYEDGKQEDAVAFKSRYGTQRVVAFQLDERMPKYTATVKAVRFYPGKVKYDLDIWLKGNTSTRLPNVDSVFVHDAFEKATLDQSAE
jgi:hypothetical protein